MNNILFFFLSTKAGSLCILHAYNRIQQKYASKQCCWCVFVHVDSFLLTYKSTHIFSVRTYFRRAFKGFVNTNILSLSIWCVKHVWYYLEMDRCVYVCMCRWVYARSIPCTIHECAFYPPPLYNIYDDR